MTRGGSREVRDDPERRCIVTGVHGPKARLIRFVATPDGSVVADLPARLPGRGVYVTADRAAIERAATKGMFARGLRTAVNAPPDLASQVEQGLARRVVELLSLARKAGTAVTGFEKVKSWLEKGKAKWLFQASDGSERGKTRLRPPDGQESLVDCLTAQELGLAFGREHAIHAALAAGGPCALVVEQAARLAGLRAPGSLRSVGGLPAGKDKKDV